MTNTIRNSLVLVVIIALPIFAQERETRFLQELRRLQLFPEAERYCRQQLAREDLSSSAAAELTVEYIRTVATHALSAPASEREALWKQARELAQQFQAKQPHHPRLLLVRVQDALTLQAQGDQQRREAENLPDATAALTTASATLRAAETMLDDIAQQISKEITQRRSQPLKAFEVTSDELARLKLQVEWQRARTTRGQAACYPPDSRDRKALLLSTLENVEAAAGRMNPHDELAGQFRVLQMGCLRELKRFEEVQRVWELLDRDDVPLLVRREAFAESLRALAAAGKGTEAMKWLEDAKYQPLLVTRDPELDLARLEVVLRRAQEAAVEKNTNELAQWQRTAATLATQLERTHGNYWGRRADQLLASIAGSSTAAADASIDLLARQADAHYLKRKYDEAEQLYDQAAQAASQAGHADREFELRYKSALVAQECKQYEIAAARLERLAIAHKQNPRAAEAHLLACWNQAQYVKTHSTAADAYAAMLEEHVARWPSGTTADQVNLWLGQWRQSQEQFATAFTAYAAVRKNSSYFTAALQGAATCARRELERLALINKANESTTREFVEYFRLALPEDGGSADQEADRIAILAAAEMLVQYLPGGCLSAEKLLQPLVKDVATTEASWRTEAQALLVVALAGQKGRATEAIKLLQANATSPAQSLAMLERLTAIAARSSPEQRASLAAVQLELFKRLESNASQLSPPQLAELKRARAAALAITGDRTAALAAYEKLAAEEPHNGSLQVAYAELLSAGKDVASLQAALGKWRQIATRSKQREERWYQAKYQVAELLARLDKKSEAVTLLRYLIETPPGIESDLWKRRFEMLLEKCEK